jgi:hypothetical protein
VSAFEEHMLTITSAFITLTSQTSKRILVPDGRLLMWTCRTTCQNDVRSAKIGNYITCGTLYLSWAFRLVLKHCTTSLCLHRMVFHFVLQLLCCPASLFNSRVCYFVIGQLVTVSGPLSGHLFCHYFPFLFFPVALLPNAGHVFFSLEVSRSHTTTHHSR